ncbi:amidohydrolase [Deltaproteobacteria bacterium Smac51]|nr:amidohydrolase [Deltaproteobacteria bacterium Smac51]
MTATSDTQSEILIYNGSIHTLEDESPAASVMAVRGRELVYVGHDRQKAAGLLGGRAEKIDLEGQTVVPGLIEGHAHFFSEGQRLREIDLHNMSKEQVLETIRQEALKRPEGQWIRGYGWNQEQWPGQRWPGKSELDAVAPNHIVALDRTDKHSIWANSRVFEAAGISEDTPDPVGGEFLRDEHGRLQGMIIGWAMAPVWEAFPPVSDHDHYLNAMKAQEEYFGFGITSLMDAGTMMRDLEVMKKAFQSGDLKLRVRAMMLAGEKQDEAYFDSGGELVRDLYDERLSIVGTKIHSDGSLGSRSAWMLADYADRPGHRGSHNFTDEELAVVMERARDHNFQVSIHAIGDAAVSQSVAVMKKVLNRRPMDHRWRIEHYQVVTKESMAEALKLGLIFSIQTIGIMTDLDMAEDRLGPERIKRAYTWREILDGGGKIVNGSDGPVESVNPFQGMYAAVTRATLLGRPQGGWYPEHRLTRLEALKTYTTWSAYSEFNENRKGSLAAGKLADFAVLDRDPLTCPIEELPEARALMTFSGGEKVHDAR